MWISAGGCSRLARNRLLRLPCYAAAGLQVRKNGLFMDGKDWALFFGVIVTLFLGVGNLIYNLRIARRTAFINTVTSERVKWISKVRENVSKLSALTEKWLLHRTQEWQDLFGEMEQLKDEIRLQLNPHDAEDRAISHLLDRFPTWQQSMSKEDFQLLRRELVASTQQLLKREWDKVKDEATRGDLRKLKRR